MQVNQSLKNLHRVFMTQKNGEKYFARMQFDKNPYSLISKGCLDSSVVEHQLRATWTRVQLLVQEPG